MTHTLPNALIVDIDGTLAHMVNRGPYDASLYHTDTVDETIRSLVGLYYIQGPKILVVSGRDDTYKDVTAKWLSDNFIGYDELYMRKGGDKRNDAIVKQEIFEEHIKGKYEIEFVLDDRNRVVKMWRELGLKCLQVADGDF